MVVVVDVGVDHPRTGLHRPELTTEFCHGIESFSGRLDRHFLLSSGRVVYHAGHDFLTLGFERKQVPNVAPCGESVRVDLFLYLHGVHVGKGREQQLSAIVFSVLVSLLDGGMDGWMEGCCSWQKRDFRGE